VAVKGLDGLKIVKVACGWRHSIAIDGLGAAYSWGWSKYGQLGHCDKMYAYVNPSSSDDLMFFANTIC